MKFITYKYTYLYRHRILLYINYLKSLQGIIHTYMQSRVIVAGGDGFIGWPLSLKLST